MGRALHHKIICQARNLTPTGAGEQQESFVDIAEVWADVTALSGDFSQAARQRYLGPGYKMQVRYQDSLKVTRRVLWQDQVWRVRSLLNPDRRRRFLEIIVVEDHP